MKKKILSLFVFALVLIALPISNAKAWDFAFRYINLKNIGFENVPNGIYVINPTKDVELPNDKYGVHSEIKNSFQIYQISEGGNHYVSYCLHAGRQVTHSYSLTLHKDFTDLKTPYGDILSASSQKVLKNILTSGFLLDGNKEGIYYLSDETVKTNDRDIFTCTKPDDCIKLIATQILVWEVQAKVRTDYSSKPTYTESNSMYAGVVAKNSKLKASYEKILSDASKLADQIDGKGSLPAINGQTIKLHWSDSEGKYVNIKKINIEDFTVSDYDKKKIKVDSTNKKRVIVSASKPLNTKETIKLSKVVGNTGLSSSSDFTWFSYNKGNDSTSYQDFLRGSYNQTIKASFKVITESGNIKISKIDWDTTKVIEGSVFNVYKCDGNKKCNEFITKVDLMKAKQSVTLKINKSGLYKFVEVEVPYGYEPLGDFTVDIKISDSGKATIKNVSDGLVNIRIDNDNDIKIYNHLVIGNKIKHIKIKKVDGSKYNENSSGIFNIGNIMYDSGVNGATFQILNKSGNPLTFTRDENGIFRYDKNGKITNIVDDGKSEYDIALLEKGVYTLFEVAVPFPYILPSDPEQRKSKFEIGDDYSLYVYDSSGKKVKSTEAVIVVKNYRSKVELTKVGLNAKPLKDVVFELYDSTKKNQIVVSQKVNGSTFQPIEGYYSYNPNIKGDPIQLVTNTDGKIIVEDLPVGTYYFKEIRTVEGHVIDKSNEWTKVVIELKKNVKYEGTKVQVYNAKNEFVFYKIDEDGNYLNDGKFKIQVYNEKSKIYEDIPLLYDEEKEAYEMDFTFKSDLYIFSPVNGLAKFFNVKAKRKYRIVEIEAPEGFVLPKASDAQVEFYTNENGYTIGDTVLINRKVTKNDEANAQAELIINISTGQGRIRYILIIGVIVLIILGLIILKRKFDK